MTVFTGTVVYRNYQSSFGRELHIRHIYVYVGRLPFTWAQFATYLLWSVGVVCTRVKGGPEVLEVESRKLSNVKRNQDKLNSIQLNIHNGFFDSLVACALEFT